MRGFRGASGPRDRPAGAGAPGAGGGSSEKGKATMARGDGVGAAKSPLQGNVIRLTQELAETAKSARVLVEMLERDPQSLLFGKKAKEEKK